MNKSVWRLLRTRARAQKGTRMAKEKSQFARTYLNAAKRRLQTFCAVNFQVLSPFFCFFFCYCLLCFAGPLCLSVEANEWMFFLCPFLAARLSNGGNRGSVWVLLLFLFQRFVEDTLTETGTRAARASPRRYCNYSNVFVVFVDFYFSPSSFLVCIWIFFNCSCCRRRFCRLIANTQHTPSQNLSFLTVARPPFCFFFGVAYTRSEIEMDDDAR